ncbi:MAG: hypothetical protein B7C24_00030 [Bacteroidetes bacterium 4572_77]|nr:MAG: hypothetical protein B7C24_00030 [Bacteroidetes bacterium 4572_77]
MTTPLSKSASALENLIKTAGDAIVLGNTEGIIICANEKLCQLCQYQTDEIIGKHISFLFSNEELQKKPLEFQLVDQGLPILTQRKLLLKNGQEIEVEMHSNKTNGSYMSIIRDITIQNEAIKQLKKTQEIALKNEQKFRNYVEQNSAIMFAIDPKNMKITFANYAAAKFYGYSQSKMQELYIYDIHTLSKKEIKAQMAAALKNHSNRFHFIHKHKNGKLLDVLVNASPIKHDGSHAMLVIIQDISDELKTKKELEKSHHTYKNILDSITDAVYVQDKNGKFVFVNKTVKDLYNYEQEDVIGKNPEYLSAPLKNNLEDIRAKIRKAYNGEPQTFEFWGLTKTGEIFPKQVMVSPGYFFDKKVTIAVSRDIRKQKTITEELFVAKMKAEESDQLKSAFLANMSHEIRTPMNAILGFSELLKDEELPLIDKNQCVNIINKSGNHLLSLINDLMDISKIHANQMKVARSKFHLNEFLYDCIEIFQQELIDKEREEDIQLVLSFGLMDQEDILYTDRTRLQQIITNLIGNAIKFTEKGKIHISYYLKDTFLLFTVQDEGIGIAPENISGIFHRFNQAKPNINEKYGGTGLGLAISKACTEMLGGKISCKSKENEGTSMSFSIPFSQ